MRRGQSLVEVLIGIAVAAIFVVGAAAIIAPSLNINKQTTIVQTKTELASELIDNVKAWASGNWNSVLALATGTTNVYYLNTASSPFTVVSASGSTLIPATITVVQAKQNIQASGNTTSTTVTIATTAGNFIAVYEGNGGSSTGNLAPTDNVGNTYTLAMSSTRSATDQSSLYYSASSSAVTSVTCNYAALYASNPCVVYEISGIATSSALDASAGSVNASNVTNASSGALTTSNATDLLLYAVRTSADETTSTFTAGSGFTLPANNSNRRTAMDYDIVASTQSSMVTALGYGATAGFSSVFGAFKAAMVTTSTAATTSIESLNMSNLTFNRYFYLSDVYRDLSGNATTTASGNAYDPATKLVTVVVTASSTPTTPSFLASFYLTRNSDNTISQASWSGGSGQNTPVTVIGTSFANSTSVIVTATGSIQLSIGGNSCIL